MLDEIHPTLTKSQKEQINFDYQDIFQVPGEKLSQTNITTHRIDTGDHLPIKMPLRRHPISQKQIISNEIDKILEDKVIEPSDSPWAANVCLVKKKDGTNRFCIDFRKL